LGKEASAGLKGTFYVSVNTSAHQASGSMGTARNSSDSTQYIECEVQSWASFIGIPETIVCTGRNNAGTTYACTSTDPVIIAAGRGLTSDSFLFFRGDASGECQFLNVTVSSDNAPKAP